MSKMHVFYLGVLLGGFIGAGTLDMFLRPEALQRRREAIRTFIASFLTHKP